MTLVSIRGEQETEYGIVDRSPCIPPHSRRLDPPTELQREPRYKATKGVCRHALSAPVHSVWLNSLNPMLPSPDRQYESDLQSNFTYDHGHLGHETRFATRDWNSTAHERLRRCQRRWSMTGTKKGGGDDECAYDFFLIVHVRIKQ